MALVQCSECGHGMSSKAAACPSCAAPNKKKTSCLAWAILIFFIFIFINTISSCPKGALRETNAATNAVKKQQEFATFDPLIKRGAAFTTGSYAKGTIPSGEYVLISKSGGYYEESLNGEVIDVERFASFGYVFVHGLGDVKVRGLIVRLRDLRGLGYSSGKAAYEALTKQSNYRLSGHYLIGTDIPAGSYIVESIGKGYLEINAGPVGKSDVLQNDLFNGTKSIRVTDGQYLKISRGKLIGP